MKIRKGQRTGCRKRGVWSGMACMKKILVFVILFFLAYPAAVFADGDDTLGAFDSKAVGKTEEGTAKRWVNHNSEEYRAIYGDNAGGSGEINMYERGEDDSDLLGDLLGSMLGGIANGLYEILRGDNIDLTIDGIVYGRLSEAPIRLTRNEEGGLERAGYKMNLMHFGLEANNAWGLFGASLYFVLRDRFALIVIPVIGMIAVGREAFRGGEKGRAGVKSVLMKLVGFFVIMYAVPYLLEAYIYIRDVATVVVRDGLSVMLGQITNDVYVGTGEIYDSMRNSWNDLGKPLLLGLILIGYAAAGIVYFWDYIKIALLIAASFGLFPLVLVWWFFKPKILTDWLNLILPALLTPFVDMVLLIAPCFVTGMFASVFKAPAGTSIGASVVMAMTVLACIWTMRIIRDRIIKLFGFEGLRGGNAGLGMALAMLMRGGMKGGNDAAESPRKPNVEESIRSSERSAEEMKSMSEVMESADSAIDAINSGDYDNFSADEGGATDEMLHEMEKEGSGYEESEFGEGVEYPDEYEDTERPGEAGDTVDEEGDRGTGEAEPVGEADYGEADYQETARGEFYGEETGREMSGQDTPAPDGERRDIRNGGVPEGMDEENLNRNNGMSGAGSAGQRRGEDATDSAGVRETERLHFEPITDEQESFVNGMADRDRRRYDNLRHIDALEDRISRNEAIMRESGYTRGAYDTARNKQSELSQRMKDLRTEEEQIVKRKDTLDKDFAEGKIKESEHSKRMDMLTRESDENQRRIQSTNDAMKSNSEYLARMEGARRADVANIKCGRELSSRRKVEGQYAYNSGLGGMSNRSYQNASDFLYQKRVDDVKKQHISYSNFDAKQYDGILSPAEREQLYRERSERMAIERAQDAIINASAKTLGVATGAITAAAFTFAGPGAMAGAGTVVGNKVSGAVRSTGVPEDDENNYPFRRETPPERRDAVETISRRTVAQRTTSNATVERQERGGRGIVEREINDRDAYYGERTSGDNPVDNSRSRQEVRNHQGRTQQNIIEREIDKRDASAGAYTKVEKEVDKDLAEKLFKAVWERDYPPRHRKDDE